MDDLQPALKQPKIIASAILVALIVIAGIIIVSIQAFGGGNDETTGPINTAPQPSSSSSSKCGLPDGEQAVPTTAPKTKWYFKGKVAAPKSDKYGPGRNAGPKEIGSCFAHNPAGALFAAASIAADIYPLDKQTKQALELRAAPSAAKQDALKQDPGASGPVSQIAGFRFEDYTPERATITLAARVTAGPNAGALGGTPLTMVWRKGDWYLQLQASSDSIVLTSLDGFVPWSAVA